MDRNQFKALDKAIANLSRLLSDGGSQLARDGRFLKALRELKAYRREGRQPPRRINLAVDLLVRLLCEEYVKGAKEAR